MPNVLKLAEGGERERDGGTEEMEGGTEEGLHNWVIIVARNQK